MYQIMNRRICNLCDQLDYKLGDDGRWEDNWSSQFGGRPTEIYAFHVNCNMLSSLRPSCSRQPLLATSVLVVSLLLQSIASQAQLDGPIIMVPQTPASSCTPTDPFSSGREFFTSSFSNAGSIPIPVFSIIFSLSITGTANPTFIEAYLFNSSSVLSPPEDITAVGVVAIQRQEVNVFVFRATFSTPYLVNFSSKLHDRKLRKHPHPHPPFLRDISAAPVWVAYGGTVPNGVTVAACLFYSQEVLIDKQPQIQV